MAERTRPLPEREECGQAAHARAERRRVRRARPRAELGVDRRLELVREEREVALADLKRESEGERKRERQREREKEKTKR